MPLPGGRVRHGRRRTTGIPERFAFAFRVFRRRWSAGFISFRIFYTHALNVVNNPFRQRRAVRGSSGLGGGLQRSISRVAAGAHRGGGSGGQTDVGRATATNFPRDRRARESFRGKPVPRARPHRSARTVRPLCALPYATAVQRSYLPIPVRTSCDRRSENVKRCFVIIIHRRR